MPHELLPELKAEQERRQRLQKELERRLCRAGIMLDFSEKLGVLLYSNGNESYGVEEIDTMAPRHCCYCGNQYDVCETGSDESFCSKKCRYAHYD